ncbi:MAG TPA: type II secretion system protein [Candidatus Dojkabacteria bacterium]|nr:type II secretion system protein [Candidatus Dojkabacteria bacterium]
MKRATYKAFTLIEMLIVMGILVILMVVGVSAGRFAIDRANQIAHQNGATQLYEALQAHFTDYGKFPSGERTLKGMTMDTGNVEGALGKYLDMGSFKGGSEADYTYFVNATKQAVVVCVTLGGKDDLTQKGITCVGNGFNDPDLTYDGTHPITTEFHPYDSEGVIQDEYQGILAWGNKSFWNGKAWGDVEEEQVPI